jgi:hypothetical protein
VSSVVLRPGQGHLASPDSSLDFIQIGFFDHTGGNQDRTLRAAIASLCGATGWKSKERVPGSNIIPDDGGFGGEAARVSNVF